MGSGNGRYTSPNVLNAERENANRRRPTKGYFLSSREAGVVQRVAFRGHQRYLWKVKYVWV